MRAKYVVAVVVVAIILAAGAAALFYVRHAPAPSAVTAPVAPRAVAPQGAVPPPQQPTPAPNAAPAECLLPGPPPVPPDGSTATDAEMKLGHDAIQHFVLELEAFQACRNAMIDHAPAGTTEARKQIWVQEGNAAVDEAHELADAFSAQLKLFHSRHK